MINTFFLSFFAFLNASDFFEQFPQLREKIAHVPLAQLPTPIKQWKRLGPLLGNEQLYVKRDDLTGGDKFYGGNKVRKLEFLLADACQKNAKGVITIGCVGTNHGLATACHAQRLGLSCYLMLKDQPNSAVVRQNLLLDHYFGANMELFETNEARIAARDQLISQNDDWYFIPAGGSVPLGCLGFVSACFELKKQIEAGSIPEPNAIYLPVGSCGTVAGLLLGCQLANISSKIVAVTVFPGSAFEFEEEIENLYQKTGELLYTACNLCKIPAFPKNQLIIEINFCGTRYGLETEASCQAKDLLQKTENITLEDTYSAKALAALIHNIKDGIEPSDSVILFWNTYCGKDFSSILASCNYKDLNQSFHKYFE